MAERGGDVVRRPSEAKRPAIDVERWNRRVSRAVDARADTGRIRIDEARRERGVAKARGHEDVGRRAPLEQPPADVGASDERILRRGGLVIDAADIDPRA